LKTVERKHLSNHKLVLEALRERLQVEALVREDPQLIARGWVTASELKDVGRRREALDLLRGIFCAVGPELGTRFITEVFLGEQTYGGKWPGCFLAEADSDVVSILVITTTSIELVEVAHAVMLKLLEVPPSAWSLIISQAEQDANVRRVLEIFVETMMVKSQLPVPQTNEPGVVVIQRERGTTLARVQGTRMDGTVINDPKIWIEVEPVPWSVETEIHKMKAIEAVNRIARSHATLVGLKELCLQAAEREAEVRSQIKTYWDELRSAARSEEGTRSIRCWVAADGLTQMSFDFSGLSEDLTGVGLATFYGDGHPFPHLGVHLTYNVFSRTLNEKAVIGHGGLLNILEHYEERSCQRGLRLLQNLAIVRELHRIAFTPRRLRQPHSDHGNGIGNGETCAGLAYFRGIGHLKRLDGTSWQPSAEALARVPSNAIVPPGHTYVASPPLHSREAHPHIKPLVLETSVCADDIQGN